MLIEYVAFGALVVILLMATFVGVRRRRTDMLSGDPTGSFPYGDGGAAGTDGAHHAAHSDFSGSSSHGDGGSHGGFDGGGGSHGGSFDGGGGFDGSGGHH